LAVKEVAVTEMAAASIADGADTFADFLASNEPFLGVGTPAAAEQVAAAKSGILAPATDEVAAAITAVVAAVSEGAEIPNGVLIPKEPASRTTASLVEAATGAAAAAAAAPAAAGVKNLTMTAPIVLPLFCRGLGLGPLFS
jgi:hypothetical protein